MQKRMNRLLNGIRDRVYRPLLVCALRQRYATLIVFMAAAALGCGMVLTGKIRTVFFPEVPGDIITINLTMEKGSPPALTLRNVRRIEAAAREVNRELGDQNGSGAAPIVKVMTAVEDDYSVEVYGELLPRQQWLQGQWCYTKKWPIGFVVVAYAKDTN